LEGRDELKRLRAERRRAIYLAIALSIALAAALLLLALILMSTVPGILEPGTVLMTVALLVSAAVVAISALVAITLDKLLKVYTAYLYYRVFSRQVVQPKVSAAVEVPRPLEAHRRASEGGRREAARPALKPVVKAVESGSEGGRKKCPYCGRELPFGDVHIICPYCGHRLK